MREVRTSPVCTFGTFSTICTVISRELNFLSGRSSESHFVKLSLYWNCRFKWKSIRRERHSQSVHARIATFSYSLLDRIILLLFSQFCSTKMLRILSLCISQMREDVCRVSNIWLLDFSNWTRWLMTKRFHFVYFRVIFSIFRFFPISAQSRSDCIDESGRRYLRGQTWQSNCNTYQCEAEGTRAITRGIRRPFPFFPSLFLFSFVRIYIGFFVTNSLRKICEYFMKNIALIIHSNSLPKDLQSRLLISDGFKNRSFKKSSFPFMNRIFLYLFRLFRLPMTILYDKAL